MKTGRIEITAKGRGKTWFRSLAAAERRVCDGDHYFIRKNGGWYRPGAHGYTTELDRAGVFIGAEARSRLSADGVVLIPVSSMLDEVAAEAEELSLRVAKLRAIVSDHRPNSY